MGGGNKMFDEMEQQLPNSGDELLPCAIFIDKEGDWYYQGSRMHRADIVSHLCRHLRWDEPSDLYVIQMGKQQCYLEVEDTPLVVTGVSHTEQEGGGGTVKELLLAIKYLESPETLDPESVWVGEENVLYCKVKAERIPARFLRPAYYQLAEFIHEDREQDRFYLLVGGRQYYIDESK